jgi:hypothetical protein
MKIKIFWGIAELREETSGNRARTSDPAEFSVEEFYYTHYGQE